jgi:hypothetical protein
MCERTYHINELNSFKINTTHDNSSPLIHPLDRQPHTTPHGWYILDYINDHRLIPSTDWKLRGSVTLKTDEATNTTLTTVAVVICGRDYTVSTHQTEPELTELDPRVCQAWCGRKIKQFLQSSVLLPLSHLSTLMTAWKIIMLNKDTYSFTLPARNALLGGQLVLFSNVHDHGSSMYSIEYVFVYCGRATCEHKPASDPWSKRGGIVIAVSREV